MRLIRSGRSRLTFLAALLAILAGGPAMAGTRAVLELFTSQGCSSCPPADKLLAEYAAAEDGIVALSFPVDYWDYLGWSDTLATHENTLRQRSYSAARGDRQVFTPEMVVNGRRSVVGSDRAGVAAAIEAERGLPVELDISMTGEAVTIHVGGAADPKESRGTVFVVLYDRAHTVPIGRGENRGRTITYTNVVRKVQRIAMWKGEDLTIDLPRAEMYDVKADGCAVLLQTETAGGLPGRVLGAAMAPGTD